MALFCVITRLKTFRNILIIHIICTYCTQAHVNSLQTVRNKFKCERTIRHRNFTYFSCFYVARNIYQCIANNIRLSMKIKLANETELGYKFNRRLNNVTFPDNLHTIEFGYEYDRKLDGDKFPRGLNTLKFGNIFNQKIDNVIFPEFRVS